MTYLRSWYKRHVNDPFVRAATSENFRARSAFKLVAILEQFKEIRSALSQSTNVLDVGAAPGSWCQVLAKYKGPNARVVGLDLLKIDPLPNVKTIQADFYDASLVDRLAESFDTKSKDELFLDLITSDLSPNLTGNNCRDFANSILLSTAVIDLSEDFLCPGGHLVLKVFGGPEAEELKNRASSLFQKTRWFKPDASRPSSPERYLICIGKLKKLKLS